MDKGPFRIPPGEYCYRVEPIREGEVLSREISRFGKDLREYSYCKGYKSVLCPYWRRTDYGTVRCEYLDREVLDDESADPRVSLKLLAERIGEEAARDFPRDWKLADEIKICGVNEDDEDHWANLD